MPRKRARDEVEPDLSVLQQDEPPKEPGLLSRLRNMWQFASFMQYIYFFGKIVKIDENLDMDEFEEMCLSPDQAGRLADLGLALLKYVSSHRGLTLDIFDEYTRRQYLAKAPLKNPYGEEEEPKRFRDFDIFLKIKVLHQLSVWTLGNAERIREKMGEKESEQVQWRIEPFGWDSEDRTYFLLDDDRLYRRTDAPIPPTPVKPKAKSKSKPKARARGTRASKRIRLSTPETEDEDESIVDDTNVDVEVQPAEQDDDFGGMRWECLAVTMDEYQDFLESIRRSRDPNEKALHKAIIESVIPILEKRAESQKQKMLKRQRELENLQKMATAKRSSRLADKQEKQREVEEAAAAERKRLADLDMARKEQRRQQEMDEARQSRMQTREQRLKEREVRRILHEEELAKLEELEAKGEDAEARHSSRHLKSEMERRQRELEAFKQEEDKWVFDCAGCGLYGENVDDGTHSIACERCNIWQHSKCNNIKESDAEREDFHFVCSDCERKEEDAKKPKIPPLKLGRVLSSSPQTDRTDTIVVRSDNDNNQNSETGRIVEGVSILRKQPTETSSALKRSVDIMDGPLLSPHGQFPGPPGYHPHGPPAVGTPQAVWTGSPLPPPQRSQPSQDIQQQPQHANGASPQASSSHYQIHQRAHASAVSSTGLQPQYATSQANGQTNGGPHHSAAQKSSPSPFPTLSATRAGDSPYRSLSPPPNSAQQQRLAGQSPTKQVSPSPRGSSRPAFQAAYPPQSSPTLPFPAATPAAQMVPPVSSPVANFMRATPQAASSPIPPVGDGPVIPQKHDPTRPPSRDHTAEVPVFPPATSLSPSRLQDGKGMDVRPGEGGLGTGNIPVKKLPDQLTSPIQAQLSSPPPMHGRPLHDATPSQPSRQPEPSAVDQREAE
ncbi:hypothetical protein K461DRAFT_250909 [Myriangium duriaei CBS 260.36]|uniref:Zinc finger PHD-type domain-containing protein n=1 Tax=Myriangium duriaei CBS 260.36 TaxID=1168546 RepID=A0A9P4MLU8_9PEZI|nr:hypothetical protein K461DRAFT_250909 [Myriangium duriaei CBS 260.36]